LGEVKAALRVEEGEEAGQLLNSSSLSNSPPQMDGLALFSITSTTLPCHEFLERKDTKRKRSLTSSFGNSCNGPNPLSFRLIPVTTSEDSPSRFLRIRLAIRFPVERKEAGEGKEADCHFNLLGGGVLITCSGTARERTYRRRGRKLSGLSGWREDRSCPPLFCKREENPA
jgi:hypothetical protein